MVICSPSTHHNLNSFRIYNLHFPMFSVSLGNNGLFDVFQILQGFEFVPNQVASQARTVLGPRVGESRIAVILNIIFYTIIVTIIVILIAINIIISRS